VPALALGIHRFDHGRLTLEYAEDVRAIRRHPWFGSRIVMETPEVLARLEADAVVHRHLREHQQALADEAQAKRSATGPRGALIDWAQRQRR
jgi:hypothetical protein